jgi:hypothetical protein
MKEYPFPTIVNNGKQFALRQHIGKFTGHSASTTNRLIDEGKIAAHLIGVQVYVEVEEALTALSKCRYQPRRSALVEYKPDLFA